MSGLRLYETVGVVEGLQVADASLQDAYFAVDAETMGVEVKTRSQTNTLLQRPPLFQVILLNDDYTPMDFVVEVLSRFFHKSMTEAVAIMLQVHNQGQGVCGVFTRDIAETKAEQVVHYARSHAHPLQCIVRKA